MRINLHVVDAEARLSEYGSPPLSEIKERAPSDRPNDFDWWMSNPKTEEPRTSRHIAAMHFYIWLATHSDAPGNCFPAVFDFIGGDQRRPDKGAIKAFASGVSPLLQYRIEPFGLMFEVTAAGRAWLSCHLS